MKLREKSFWQKKILQIRDQQVAELPSKLLGMTTVIDVIQNSSRFRDMPKQSKGLKQWLSDAVLMATSKLVA